MFISLSQLYGFTKQANRTFEKGIVYIIISQIVAYFANAGYHDETRGCLMDFCRIRSDMIEDLKNLKLCEQCGNQLADSGLVKADDEMLDDEMKV